MKFLILVFFPSLVFSQIYVIHYVEDGCGDTYKMLWTVPNKMKVVGVEIDSSYSLTSSGSEVERVYNYPYDFVLLHNKGWRDTIRLYKNDSLIFSRAFGFSYPDQCRPYFEDINPDRNFYMDNGSCYFDSLTLLEWLKNPELKYYYPNCTKYFDIYELKRFSISFYDDVLDKYIKIPALGSRLNKKQTDALRSFRFGTSFVIQELVAIGPDDDFRNMPPMVLTIKPPSFFENEIYFPISNPEAFQLDSSILFEHFEDVQVFQYFDNDSLNAKVTHSMKLDENGNVIAEYYSGYQEQQNSYGDLGYIIMEYDENNKLKEKTNYFHIYDGRIYKSLYHYKDSILEREETFVFKGKARQITDKGTYDIKGCNIIKEENENAVKWEIYEIRLFEYDNEGRLISEFTPYYLRHDVKINYEYHYNGKLYSKAYNDGYPTFYNYVGSRIYQTGGCSETGEYTYDSKGKLVMFKSYNSEGKNTVTHIYKYK